ncbi:hypothetical protein GTS_37400 [Gandjariella thermophila]|uniref:Uncharacterized protein n=1 Tax=Gandjariella thermophila TaxID=1931992 RepID=A0A4D4JDX7_9PSEU|nr:hypothetical protein GTS_37400 [Gandjariella thermophila]
MPGEWPTSRVGEGGRARGEVNGMNKRVIAGVIVTVLMLAGAGVLVRVLR